MPTYKKSNSQSQSKNGGRRRKRTMRKLRRGKSRKVMRGGEDFKFKIDILVNIWVRLNEHYLDRFYIPLLKKLVIDINEQDEIVLKSKNKEAIKQKFESYPGLIDKINDVNSQLYKSLKAEWRDGDGT